MNDIPPDSLALTGEQKNDVRRMAALGYAPGGYCRLSWP